MKKISYGRQTITDDDINAVVEVLKSDLLTQGPKIAEFEKDFAEYVGAKYAVANANGTAALHLCAMALGIKEGQKVITTTITFAATANCVQYCGGDVEFVDIDPETYLIDLKKVRTLLEKSPPNTYTGIIPVDYAGYPVNLEEVRNIADEFGLWIIEDACHAPGGYFIDSSGNKQNCGNGLYADLAIFSFHPVKHITCGEGGMIATNNEELYHKLRMLRTHGIQQQPELRLYNHGMWYYEMQELGYNYRLTDIACALGISQLKRARVNLQKRHKIINKYNTAFKETDIRTPLVNKDYYHAYHLFVIQYEKRDELMKFLFQNDIITQVHYIPLYQMPFYEKMGYVRNDYPHTEEFYKKCLSIPVYPGLLASEQDFVIEKILEFVRKNGEKFNEQL